MKQISDQDNLSQDQEIAPIPIPTVYKDDEEVLNGTNEPMPQPQPRGRGLGWGCGGETV